MTNKKAEDLFKDLGKKIDLMIADLGELKEQTKEKYGDRFDEMKRNADTFKKEMKNFTESRKDRWGEIEESLEKAGKEIKNAFHAAFSNSNKSKKEKEA